MKGICDNIAFQDIALKKIVEYLVKFGCVAAPAGLKLQVEDDKLNGGKSVGDVLLLDANKSESLAALIDSGLRATLPGVILGSSSIVLI